MFIKAKRKNNKQWIKGYYIYDKKTNKHWVAKNINEHYEIYRHTICRHWFNDFFENDIIQFPKSKMIIKYGDINIYSLNFMVNFRYYGFYLQSIEFTDDPIVIEETEYFLNNYEKLKIISNKYD